MSEQIPGQAGLDAGATDVAVVSDKSTAPVAASNPDAEPGLIAPDHEAPKPDAPETEAPKAEAPEPDAPKAEAPKLEALKAEAPEAQTPTVEPPKTEPPAPGQIFIMRPAHRSRNEEPAAERPKAEAAPAGKRRLLTVAAVIALAAMTGAIGGALATAGVMHFAARNGSPSPVHRLEASLARIDADVLALKSSVEHTSRMATGQYNKAGDRLDRLEKAQAEPAARLARLSEAVERLRAATAAAPAQSAAAREVTGSVTPSQQQVAAVAPVPVPVPAPPRTQPGRLPTVDGWVLRNVAHGSALVEGRGALYEVYAGDPLPGVGRVDAIRRQDGRWVVVTTKGLIVSR